MKFATQSLVLLVCIVGVQNQIAQADVITSQPLQPTFQGEFSNLGPSNAQVADDFSLTATTTLDSISWFGRYDGQTSLTNPVSFSIRFFNNATFAPAGLPILEVNAAVNAVNTGLTLGAVPWFSYSTTLPPLVLAPGTYWVSVLETDTRTPIFGTTQWLWGDTVSPGLRAIRNNDSQPWSSSLDINHAFTLNGTPVPELPSGVLLISGLVLLSFTRKHAKL